MPEPRTQARPEPPCWDWAKLRSRARSAADSLLPDPHDAEDAAQEAVVRAWRQQASCRHADDPEPWLARIARNEAHRLIGRRRPSTRLDDERQLEDPRELLEDRTVRTISIAQALEALTPAERRLVELRYEADLTQPSVANLLGMPEGTVKVKLHRIRKRLETIITEAA